jgi:serine/threonine protein kinase
MKFSGDAHPHLVSLLATYEQFKRFYLIFYWAEADLLDYWSKKNPTPSMDYDNMLWIAEQCSGITDGLSKIHRYESTDSKHHHSKRHDATLDPKSANKLEVPAYKRPPKQLYGRHGDIKPQNILWFRDPDDENDKGILKITDFGLTEFSANNSKSYKLNSNIAASPSYRPPEIDLEDGVIGRSYDIWTLGCLYLELITWLLGGWELVEKFRVERMAFDPMWFDTHSDTFFEIVRCKVTNNTIGAMVKPKVTKVTTQITLTSAMILNTLVHPQPPFPSFMHRIHP